MKSNICKIITGYLRQNTLVLLEIRQQLYADIARYQPGLCDDGSVYRIAFTPAPGKTRVKTKTGRFLTKKLHLTDWLTTCEIEHLASAINLQLFGIQDVKLVTGADITDAYEKAIGGTSCMTGHDADKTKLYESNLDKFAMLVMRAGTAEARAIVSTLDNGHKLLDRIYTNNQSMIEIMQSHAKKQGWYYRMSATLGYSSVVDKDGDLVNDDDLVVSDLAYEDGELPFMDTLTTGTETDGLLTVRADGGDFSLTQTSGRFGGTCADCGEHMDDEESTYIEGLGSICETCYADSYFYCNNCGESRHTDGCEQLDGNAYICDSCCGDYENCADCGELVSESYEVASGDKVCEECLDNYTSCEGCKEFYPHDGVEHVGDDAYCSDCADAAKEALEHENA